MNWFHSGWRRDTPDHRDFAIESTVAPKELPASSDLRKYDSPVLNQGKTSACTAHATDGVWTWYQLYKRGTYTPGSRAFIYWWARKYDGITGDNGATLRSSARTIANYGVPPENKWTFIPSHITKSPTQSVDALALKSRATNYYRLDPAGTTPTTLLNTMKSTLVTLPIMGGFTCYNSIFEVDTDGLVPLPKANEEPVGGHAIEFCGYDSLKKWLLFKNSWTPKWGDNGYGRLPEEYVTMGIVKDLWVVAGESDITAAPAINSIARVVS